MGASDVGVHAVRADAAGELEWLRGFCAATSIDERLRLLNARAGARLHSDTAARAWLQLLERAQQVASAEQMGSLIRQYLMLAPEHVEAAQLFHALSNPPTTAPAAQGEAIAGDTVFMIVSCDRYLELAQRVLADLQQRGAHGLIVTGNPTLQSARQVAPHQVALPVPDSYEALTPKVLEGLTYIRSTYGAVNVAKLDDDLHLLPAFDPQRIGAVASTLEYAGAPMGDSCDRCWHLGKTSRPIGIFSRRHGLPFAYGPFYLLGARAVEQLVREWVFYPGEFDGQLFEDYAIGQALHRAGFKRHALALRPLGIDVSEVHRPIEQGVQARSF